MLIYNLQAIQKAEQAVIWPLNGFFLASQIICSKKTFGRNVIMEKMKMTKAG